MEFKLQDFFMFDPPANTTTGRSSDPDVRQQAANTKGLKVIMTASHAGKLTKNYTLYPPSTFQRCCHTFVTPYQKVVQTHHNDKSDPIGRIIGARFLPYQASEFSDSHRDVFLRFQDAKSKLTMLDSIRFLDETGVLFDSDWKGLGELELEAMISDQDAIEKILDGRYNTVSVGMDPKQVYCSICKNELKSTGPCEHFFDRGKKDEESERLIYLISGDVTGMEVSYINHPADDLAFNKDFELVSNSQSETLPNPYTNVDSVNKRNVTYELLDAFELKDETTIQREKEEKEEEKEQLLDSSNAEKKELGLEQAIQIAVEAPQSMTDEASLLINLAIEDKVLTTKARKRLKSESFCGPGRTYPAHDRAHAANALSRVKQHGSPSLQKRVRACVCRKFPSLPACSRSKDENLEWTQEIRDELDSIIKHPLTGVDTTLGQYIFGIEDALTEQDLEKLSDSVFCGPNKSFQVISLEHHEACLELLENYQGSGDMTVIKDKVEDAKDKLQEEITQASLEDNVQTEEEPTKTEGSVEDEGCFLDKMENEELIKLFIDMERQLVSRKIRAPRQCFECDSRDQEKTALEDQVKDLENTVSVLRKEIQVAMNDCQASDKRVIELTEELEDAYRNTAVQFSLLVNKEKEEQEIQDSVKELDLDTLKDSVSTLAGEMSSVTDFVRSGLSREPEPEETVTIEDADGQESVTEEENTVEYSKEELALFNKLARMSDNKRNVAETYLRDLKRFNKIRKDLTLEEICDIVKVN